MIECKVGKDVRCNIMATGSTKDLANDTLFIINAIYNSLKDRDPTNARMFRLLIRLQLCTDSFWNIKPDGTAVSIKIPKKEEPEVE